LGGGLFYNTYFNTLISTSGIFERVFVPINPGNAGLAVGGALLVGRERGGNEGHSAVSCFWGPNTIRKRSGDTRWLQAFTAVTTEARDATVAALGRGQLVAWFQGRMEWGH
jgi:carbamoyltransferase